MKMGFTHIKENVKVTLGPILVMLALVMFISKYSTPLALFGIFAAVSMPAVWKYQLKGALYAAVILLLSFVMIYSLHESSYSIVWILVWCAALCTGLSITALCSQEYYRAKLLFQEEQHKRTTQLEQGYHATQKHLEEELHRRLGHVSSLEQDLAQRDHEIYSLKQLVIASKEEADKYFMQCEHLNDEVLKLHKTASRVEEINYLKREIEEKNKILLKQLNEARVERYQYQLLAAEPLQEKPVENEQEHTLNHHKELTELEKERATVKKSYEEHLRDYQALSDKLQTFFALDELAYYTHRDLSWGNSYTDLKRAFQEKSKLLQELRVEIFKIEGTIVQLKKELKISVEEEFSPGSYLAVADQECLRLEEENAILLQLLSQTLPLLEQRSEKREVKEPLEFHNQFE
jgi:hypothetical protein